MGSYKKGLTKDIRNTLLFKVEELGVESKKLKKYISKVSEELAGKLAKHAKKLEKERARTAKAAEKKARKEKSKENPEESSVASVGVVPGTEEMLSSVEQTVESAETSSAEEDQPATSMPVPQDAPSKTWVENRPDNEGATLVAGEQNEDE